MGNTLCSPSHIVTMLTKQKLAHADCVTLSRVVRRRTRVHPTDAGAVSENGRPDDGTRMRPAKSEKSNAPRAWHRGIHLAPYTTDGCPVLIAVTQRGDYLTSVVVRPGVRPKSLTRVLRQALNDYDPVKPTLRLVKQGPGRDEWVCEYDPTLDRLVWAPKRREA
jgi:hypothetical protein